jgi:hypothetical protein
MKNKRKIYNVGVTPKPKCAGVFHLPPNCNKSGISKTCKNLCNGLKDNIAKANEDCKEGAIIEAKILKLVNDAAEPALDALIEIYEKAEGKAKKDAFQEIKRLLNQKDAVLGGHKKKKAAAYAESKNKNKLKPKTQDEHHRHIQEVLREIKNLEKNDNQITANEKQIDKELAKFNKEGCGATKKIRAEKKKQKQIKKQRQINNQRKNNKNKKNK